MSDSEALREPLRSEEFASARQGLSPFGDAPAECRPPLAQPLAVSEPAPAWAWDQAAGSKVIDGQFHGVFELAPREPPAPRWVRVEVQPDETLEEIATRFGVAPAAVAEWNHLSGEGKNLRHRRGLRIHAQRFPRYRSRLYYWVQQRDETWESVARAFGLDVRTLQRFNRHKSERPLRRGQRLTVWAESALPRWGQPLQSTRPVEVVVPVGALSRGLPSDGSLVNGQPLPESELYTLKRPHVCYASTQTMAQLQRGISAFRRRTGSESEVLIASASARSGGHFSPHLSHQSGRDIDIGLVAFPIFARGQEAKESEVDWGATWALLQELIDSGQVEFVFVVYSHQKKLYEAAQAMGASDATLEAAFQYPRGPSSPLGLIRHSPGHQRHFHIRFRCGPADRDCRSSTFDAV